MGFCPAKAGYHIPYVKVEWVGAAFSGDQKARVCIFQIVSDVFHEIKYFCLVFKG
jgi:hypothetical protein